MGTLGGSLTDNGNQQINVYPQQQLSSVYGNTMLNKIVPPGTEGVSVTLTSASSTEFSVNILAGSTFYFLRSAEDPVLKTQARVLGKITLNATYSVAVPKALWNPGSTSSTQAIYIVADWSFLPGIENERRYMQCTYKVDSNILAEKAYDTLNDGVEHSLVVCTLLNNQYARDNWGGLITSASSPSFYHVSYDYAISRNVFSNIERPQSSFVPYFDPKGYGVYIGSGSASINGSVSNYYSSFLDTTGASISYPNRGDTTANSRSGVTLPPIGVQYYISDVIFNTKIDVIRTSTKSSYYQIDFLRYRVNDQTHLPELVWESFLQPSGSLDFSSYAITPKNLKDYLDNYVFNLVGSGITILVSVRPRSAIPDTQGSTNIIWPEHTLILKDDVDFQVSSSQRFLRHKIPVFTANDIGLN